MKRIVLIIAPEDDGHAKAVAATINSKSQFGAVIWDSGYIPTKDQISFYLDNSTIPFMIHSLNRELTLDSLVSIWWRRPSKFYIDSDVTDQKVRDFCRRECDVFFKGVLDASGIPLVNNPGAESAANRKPLQLRMAQKVGLTIPKTILSNDPNLIRDFWRKTNFSCIYKPFTSPSWRVAETRLMTEEDLASLDSLRHAPIIMQEKIEKCVDIRVNIFGNKVFAAEGTSFAFHCRY